MPRFFGHRFVGQVRGEDWEFELELNLNDMAIMRDELEIEVVAKRRPYFPDEPGYHWEKKAASLSFNPGEETVSISIEGIVVGQFKLAPIIDLLPLEEGLDNFHDAVMRTAMGHAVEEALQAIPVAAEPFFGCLIKAGISTTVGQTTRCIMQTRDVKGYRLRAILKCLGHNITSMLSKAVARTIKCWITLGWG